MIFTVKDVLEQQIKERKEKKNPRNRKFECGGALSIFHR